MRQTHHHRNDTLGDQSTNNVQVKVVKQAAIAGVAVLTLLDISAATPVAAQGVTNPFAGGYAGVHAGGATTNSMSFTGAPYTIPNSDLPAQTTNVAAPGRNDEFDFNGALGGVQSGFNMITPGNFMFGIEGDWTYLGMDDTVRFNSGRVDTTGGDGVIFQHRSEVELQWQGTIRGRAGFVAGNALFFATAGVAFLNVDWKETASITDCAQACDPTDVTFTRNYSDSETLIGPVVGVGVEFAIAQNMIVGGDYLYETFDSFGSVPFGYTSTPQQGRLGDLDIHKVRVRVSVRFGAPTQ